ncbi:hypothetical protein RF11_00815 [Thelohanellus kitauei]|uniref:Uncharacterized protein n=1 Tax=Thelohanellus kitauei TaxID=669202 RepID=A0A0C2MRS7_THEKT|nr:hypothetical protein RF11_00815 [Thelohanellus kitauei]
MSRNKICIWKILMIPYCFCNDVCYRLALKYTSSFRKATSTDTHKYICERFMKDKSIYLEEICRESKKSFLLLVEERDSDIIHITVVTTLMPIHRMLNAHDEKSRGPFQYPEAEWSSASLSLSLPIQKVRKLG